MDIFEAMQLRHSVREYRPEPVPTSLLRQMVAAAHLAPSSHNLQPWEFLLVTDPAVKRALKAACNDQRQVEQAGAAIVCLGSLRQQDALADRMEAALPPDATEGARAEVRRMRQDEPFRRSHVITSTYIGISYLTLAAVELGLATCWMGDINPELIRALLGIPEDFIVVAVLSVGWPVGELNLLPHKRRPVEEIVHWNRF